VQLRLTALMRALRPSALLESTRESSAYNTIKNELFPGRRALELAGPARALRPCPLQRLLQL